MASVRGFPIIVTSINLVGSLSSFIGSAFIIATYLILPKRRHFRHVLILNLATADCLNALNLAISALYILIERKGLSNGSSCLANGFITQITVQATDCSILAITLVTVFTISRFRLQASQVIWNARKVVLVTVGIWTLPTITSVIALAKNWYGPVSGSWCWIVQNPRYLRFALTQGWRILFIITEIALYAYLHFFLKKHHQEISKLESRKNETLERSLRTKAEAIEEYGDPSNSRLQTLEQDHNMTDKQPGIDLQFRSIQRILLLNAYPLAYIILWIPGIVNRFVELSGHTSRVTQVLQASTQFVGLANALTYGWNESIAKQLYKKCDVRDGAQTC